MVSWTPHLLYLFMFVQRAAFVWNLWASEWEAEWPGACCTSHTSRSAKGGLMSSDRSVAMTKATSQKALDSGKPQPTTNPNWSKCIDLLTALPKASLTSLLGSFVSLKWCLLRRSASHIPFHFAQCFAQRSWLLIRLLQLSWYIRYSYYCACCLSIDVEARQVEQLHKLGWILSFKRERIKKVSDSQTPLFAELQG